MPNLEDMAQDIQNRASHHFWTGHRLPPPSGTDGNPIVVIVFDGIIQRQEESHGGDGTLKRSKRYSDDGYGGGDGDGRTACRRANEWDGNDLSTTTIISLTATKTTINKKYDEGGWM